jgi:3-hydroxybutyryl-CoA dehydrogenase
MGLEIIILGSERQAEELVSKLGPSHTYFRAKKPTDAGKVFSKDRIVFDFTPGTDLFDRGIYVTQPGMTVFLDTTLISLANLAIRNEPSEVFGFCGLPTFVNRSIMEVSVTDEKSLVNLKLTFERLSSDYIVVADKVGMVTPRVICMIINEAYYTAEEGTASREDIDMAMKLGTNYPWGPFEWARRIGLENVGALLQAVYRDSKDDRYRICPLLESEIHAVMTVKK